MTITMEETNNGKIPMIPKEDEEHAHHERVARARSMGVEGAWEIQEPMEELNTLDQRN